MSDNEDSSSSEDIFEEDLASDSEAETDNEEAEEGSGAEESAESSGEEAGEDFLIPKKNLKAFLSTQVVPPPVFGQAGTYQPYVPPQVAIQPSQPLVQVATGQLQAPLQVPLQAPPFPSQVQQTYPSQPVAPIISGQQGAPVFQQYGAFGQTQAPAQAQPIQQPVAAPYTGPVGGISTVTSQPLGFTYPATASPKKQGAAKTIRYTFEELKAELRLEDLKEIARSRGIKGYSAKKKDDLIALLLQYPLTNEIKLSVTKGNTTDIVTLIPGGRAVPPMPGQVSQPGIIPGATGQPAPNILGAQTRFPVPSTLVPPTVPMPSQPFLQQAPSQQVQQSAGVPPFQIQAPSQQVQQPAGVPPFQIQAPIIASQPAPAAPLPEQVVLPAVSQPTTVQLVQEPGVLELPAIPTEGDYAQPIRIVPGSGEVLGPLNPVGPSQPQQTLQLPVIQSPLVNPTAEAYRQEVTQLASQAVGPGQLAVNLGNVNTNRDILGVTYSADVTAAADTYKI